MNTLARYGAVTAKARALWGMRLKNDDYRRMAALKTLPELAGFLRSNERWGRALEGVHTADIHRGELESRLRLYQLEEALRIYPYIAAGDKALLHMPVLTQELTQIMRWLRLASAGHAEQYSFHPPPFFARHSKIDYAALSSAATYDGLMTAVAATGFAPVLEKLERQPSGFPTFAALEVALQSDYFRQQVQLLKKHRDDGVRQRLLESIGIQADLINIRTILRVKRYYPQMEGQFLSYLLPVNHHISPALLRSLYTAPNEGEVLRLLCGSYYGSFFAKEGLSPEEYSSEILYEHHRRGLRESAYGIVSVLSFLYLSELELGNIIHMIECIRYGVPQEQAMGYIVGRD